MSYTVKDSGQRKEFPSGMRRDTDKGKPRYDLIIPAEATNETNMLYRLAEHMAKGAEKYGERNWEKANSEEEHSRFKASAFRHFMQWFYGEVDEDHAAAVLFNIQAAEFTKKRKPYAVEFTRPSTITLYGTFSMEDVYEFFD